MCTSAITKESGGRGSPRTSSGTVWSTEGAGRYLGFLYPYCRPHRGERPDILLPYTSQHVIGCARVRQFESFTWTITKLRSPSLLYLLRHGATNCTSSWERRKTHYCHRDLAQVASYGFTNLSMMEQIWSYFIRWISLRTSSTLSCQLTSRRRSWMTFPLRFLLSKVDWLQVWGKL